MAVVIASGTREVLSALTGNPSTGPFSLGLMVQAGSGQYSGVEVSGGGYSRKPVAFEVVDGDSVRNSGAVLYSGMPACVVVGFEVYDSSGGRVVWASLGAGISVGANETFVIAAGALVIFEVSPGRYKVLSEARSERSVPMTYDGTVL